MALRPRFTVSTLRACAGLSQAVRGNPGPDEYAPRWCSGCWLWTRPTLPPITLNSVTLLADLASIWLAAAFHAPRTGFSVPPVGCGEVHLLAIQHTLAEPVRPSHLNPCPINAHTPWPSEYLPTSHWRHRKTHPRRVEGGGKPYTCQVSK